MAMYKARRIRFIMPVGVDWLDCYAHLGLFSYMGYDTRMPVPLRTWAICLFCVNRCA